MIGGEVLDDAGARIGCGGSILVARLGSDGTLAEWKVLLSNVARTWAAAVAHEGKLYVTGGQPCNAGVRAGATLVADLLPNGGLSVLSETTALTDRWGHGAAAIGSWLFVTGGDSEKGLTSSVMAAPIVAPGSLGTFTAAAPLPSPRAYFGWAQR